MFIPPGPKANVLVDGKGRARLAYFGLTPILRREESLLDAQNHTVPNSITLAAPEIWGGGPPSKEGDVFTFALIVIEVCTGEVPVIQISHPACFGLDVHRQTPVLY